MGTDHINVGVVGSGSMGLAIANGLVASGMKKRQIFLIEKNKKRINKLKRTGFRTGSPYSLLKESHLIILAVKPKDLPGVLEELESSGLLTQQIPILSICSGFSLRDFRKEVGSLYPIFRARPNLFVGIGKGNILLARTKPLRTRRTQFKTVPHFRLITEVLSRLGTVFEVPEKELTRHTWESSTIPAVLVSKIFLHRMREYSTSSQKQLAFELMVSGIEGLTRYLRVSMSRPGFSAEAVLDGLVQKVATTGGLNDEALGLLEKEGFWDVLSQGAEAYLKKDLSLSRDHLLKT